MSLATLLASAEGASGAAARRVVERATVQPRLFVFGELLAHPNIAAVRCLRSRRHPRRCGAGARARAPCRAASRLVSRAPVPPRAPPPARRRS